MGSSFFGLNVAMSGLYTSQRALDITNHNITNTNTPGFSRQVINQKAETPTATSDGTGMVGNGAQIIGTDRIRDTYLDFKYWSENVSLGEWSTKETMLSDIEAVFNEPSDSGFNTVLNEFFSAIQELSKDPSSLATRALVREKGVTLANYFNSTAANLEKIQSDINYSVKSKVDEINSISTQIAALNEQIYKYELQGDTAGDIRDQRGVLVDRLSKLANISAQEVVVGKHQNGKDNIRFQIVVNGKYLVDYDETYEITYSQDDVKNNPEDIPGIYNLYWEDGTPFNPGGGELKGYLDVRDGAGDANNSFKGVPYYLRQMNTFVKTFARAFNEGMVDYDGDGTVDAGENKVGHADGYGLNNVTGDPLPGIRFFTMNEQDSATFVGGAVLPDDIYDIYDDMTAGNFSISQDVIDNLANILTTTTAGDVGQSDVLLSIADFRHDSGLFAEGAPEDFMSSLISNLGIDTEEAARVGLNQETIVKQIDNRRSSNSGVSLDEEMSNMVKFQHAYNASARMITTISEIYDMLINRMGSF